MPSRLLQEVVRDGCCPLHLRLQLFHALQGGDLLTWKLDEGKESAASSIETDAHAALAMVGLLGGPVHQGCASSALTGYLPLEDLLRARAASSATLCGLMQRVEDAEAFDQMGEQFMKSARSPIVLVHSMIRCRLWLHRLGQLSRRLPDEQVFETSVRSYVDEALRRRLTAEVEAARSRMEEEVREAKATMLQCVQAISEEVDRRVQEKVSILQDEFDRKATEQVRALQDAVERRVGEQTAALRAEVDRRSDCVRQAVEARARAQEDAARKLQDEVTRIRQELESRVGEQEDVAGRLAVELAEVRRSFRDLVLVRQALEERLVEQEVLAEGLRTELLVLQVSAERSTWHRVQGCFSSCIAGFLHMLPRPSLMAQQLASTQN